MAISNLSSQYISASYQNLLQISASGEIFNGSGTQVTNLVLTSVTASFNGLVSSASAAITANTANTATSASYATTASFALTIPSTINGNLAVNGTLTANTYIVSSSVVNMTVEYASGSTAFGNSSDDTHTFIGSVTVTGSFLVSGSSTFRNIGPAQFTGSVTSTQGFTGSFFGIATTASYINSLTQNVQITGSLNTSANIQANKFIFTEGSVNEGTTGQKTIAVGGNYLYLYTGTNGLYINNQANSANNVVITDAGAVQTKGSITAGWPGNDQNIYFGGSNASLDWASTGAKIQYSVGALQFSSVGSTNNMVLAQNGGATFNYGITGSLLGTATTASYISPTFISASAAAAGFGAGGSGGTGSVTINNNVDNYIVTATGTTNTLNGESNLKFNGTRLEVTGSVVATNFTGSLFGTASVATNSVSSSYALTASYALNGGGGSTFPYTGTAAINGSLQVTGSVKLFDSGTTALIEYTTGYLSTSARATVDFNLLGASGASRGFILPLQQPAVAAAGSVYFDTGTGRLYIYDGTSWLFTQLT